MLDALISWWATHQQQQQQQQQQLQVGAHHPLMGSMEARHAGVLGLVQRATVLHVDKVLAVLVLAAALQVRAHFEEEEGVEVHA